MNGFTIGGIEILFFFILSGSLKCFFNSVRNMNRVAYYWLCMTTLTGIWEATYIANYNEVVSIANELVDNKTHVWTNQYDFSYVLPWKLSKIFYAEYGAWADREYMSEVDPWSHTVEGTHMIFCAVFAFFGLLSGFERKTIKSVIVVAMAMAFQLMNSILYMIEYGIQTNDKYSVNYDTNDFPVGTAMVQRPFMYVNVFWLLIPTYIIFFELCNLTIFNETSNSDDYLDEHNVHDDKSYHTKTDETEEAPPPEYKDSENYFDKEAPSNSQIVN